MPRKYFAVLVAGVALLAAGVWATTTRQSEEPPEPSFPVELTDDFGVTVTVTAPPSRIVTLAPQHTETVFALGAGGKVVGVSAGETYPPQAMAIEPMTTGDGVTPDPAKIIAADPQLVIASTDPAGWAQPLAQAGIVVVSLQARTLQEALDDMRTIGRLLDANTPAARLTSGIDLELRRIQAALRDAEPVAAFVESFYPPLTTISEGGFTQDLMRSAKVEVVGLGAPDPRAVAAARPRFYLAPRSTAPDPQALAARPGFSAIEAVQQGRIALFDDALLFRPGPRIAEAVRAAATAVGHSLP